MSASNSYISDSIEAILENSNITFEISRRRCLDRMLRRF